MIGQRVVVQTRDGGEAEGVVRQTWFGPFTGRSYVVDLLGGGFVISPVLHVRRHSESEA